MDVEERKQGNVGEKKHARGRPKQEFTQHQIKKASESAFKGCQNNTIAKLLDCDVKTLEKYLSKVLAKKRAERKLWLRDVQHKRATDDKSPAMAVFLGKNELDQADKSELSGPGGKPITVVIDN